MRPLSLSLSLLFSSSLFLSPHRPLLPALPTRVVHDGTMRNDAAISYANTYNYKRFNQNYDTFTVILLIKIVMCRKFP